MFAGAVIRIPGDAHACITNPSGVCFNDVENAHRRMAAVAVPGGIGQCHSLNAIAVRWSGMRDDHAIACNMLLQLKRVIK